MNIEKFMDLEKEYQTVLALSHIYMLEILLKKPNEWHYHSDFPKMERYTFSRTSKCFSDRWKNIAPQGKRQCAKNLFWIEDGVDEMDKRAKKIRLSDRGKNALK